MVRVRPRIWQVRRTPPGVRSGPPHPPGGNYPGFRRDLRERPPAGLVGRLRLWSGSVPGCGSVSDIRNEYGHPDPWGEFEDDETFGADATYEGPHETIPDMILLTEVVIAFEYWADDFRYWDRLNGKIAASQWEQDSPFSELASIKHAKTGVER